MKKYINYFLLLLFGFALGMTYSHLLRGPHFGPPPFGSKEEPRDPSEHFVERLSDHLDLSEEQNAKALAIFKHQHEKLELIRKETFPKLEEIREETRKNIRELLDQKQQSQFDAMRKDPPEGPPPPR